MRLFYSPKAQEDLRELQRYIEEELFNPKAAQSTVQGIIQSCSVLKKSPQAGGLLSEKTGRKSNLRYWVVKRYIAFYYVDEDVHIIRILDSRTDYLQQIFPE